MTFRSVMRAAITAVVVVGAATTFAAPAAADEPTDTDSKAIDMARSMCRKLGNGGDKGIEKALYYIKDNTDLSNDQITTFAGIAAQAYCAEKVQKPAG